MLTVRYDWLDVRPGQVLLDIGAGAGRHSFEAARRGASAIACDLASVDLAGVRDMADAIAKAGELTSGGRVEVVIGDVTRLPFADATFDRIIASEVLEHVDDDVAALAELRRVLRPGGTVAVTVPSYLPERICWALSEEYHAPFVPGGHVRIYRASELRRRLTDAGLVCRRRHRAHALHSPYWWLRCAVGPTNDDHRAVRAYRRLLEWDIVRAPRVTRTAERVLDPVLGKSLVLYATRPAEDPT